MNILIADDEKGTLMSFGFKWFKIEELTVASLEEGRLTEVSAGGKRVGVLKRNGAIFSFTAACPHAGGALCAGWVDPLGRIVCPEHKYRFDPANGRNTSGEGYKLFTYPVEIRDGAIFVGLP